MKKNIIIGVMAIAIIGLLSIIIYQNNDRKDVLDKNIGNNENNQDIQIGDINNIKKEKLVQFDGDFYNLKDIAKEYVSIDKVNNNVDFNYDLDSDGTLDKISFYKKNDYSYAVKLNGNEVIINDFTPQFYIVDLNENDSSIEVVLYDEGPSGDPNYAIYSKKGNSFEQIYTRNGDVFKTDRKGLVLINDSFKESFSPSIYFDYINIENGKVDNKFIDVETINNVNVANSNWYFSLEYNDREKVYNSIGLNPDRIGEINIEQLTEDLTFKIINVEFVKNEYVIKVKLADGREGYVFFIAWVG